MEATPHAMRRRRDVLEIDTRCTPAKASLERNGGPALASDTTNSDGCASRTAFGAASLEVARRVVGELFGPAEQRSFAVRYGTNAIEPAGCARDEAPRFTVVLSGPSALRRMFFPPTETAIAEAFLRGDFDIEGDLEAAAGLADVLADGLRRPATLLRLVGLLLRLPRRDTPNEAPSRTAPPRRVWQPWRQFVTMGQRHALARDAHAIKHHYDVGNDFYALWLDEEHQAYSCAYFPTGEEALEAAQRAKLEHICRKLRLRPGERLLDIGCGWGGLIRHAVKHYGVEALGITLSEAQASVARARIAAEGLGDRCRVDVMDYRALTPERTFDKVASVGMFEHVGRGQLPRYFATAIRLTRPGGLFLNHGIVSLDDARGPAARPPRRLWGKGRFMDRYVFPDGELVPLAAAIAAAEGAGFETRDVESWREHYPTTLRHWVGRLERRGDEARARVGELTYRVWRLYMAASARAFATARIGVVQVLLARPDECGACQHPPSRAALYA